MKGMNSSTCSGATTCEPISDANLLRPKTEATSTTRIVVSPTDGLMPTTMPNAKLHASRRGVTPPRRARSSGRSTWQRNHSRMDCGTSTQASTPVSTYWWARKYPVAAYTVTKRVFGACSEMGFRMARGKRSTLSFQWLLSFRPFWG